MRILHLLSQHPESTGSGIYLQNILKESKKAGHDNYLIAGISQPKQPSLEGLSPENCNYVKFGAGELTFKIPGMSDVMPYPSSTFRHLTARNLDVYEKQWSKAITQAVEAFRPTLIHSHHLWIMSAIAREICPNIPMVTSCHSTDLRQFELCRHLQAKVLPMVATINRVLALSNSQASKIEHTLSITKERIDVVGGGIDHKRFRFHHNQETSTVELLYAGKLSLAKGVDWLLMALAKIEIPGKNLRLHLVGSGSGSEQEQCRSLASGLGDKVTIHGQLDQLQLAKLMAHCHIFILPSFYEGLPLVLLEALASGCRVITTNLPGSLEILKNISDDLVKFIKLPRLATVDRPKQEDLPRLIDELAKSIVQMADRVRKSATSGPNNSTNQLNPIQVAKIISPYRWEEVFKRMEASYAKARSDVRF